MEEGEIFKIPNIDEGILKFVEEGASYFSEGEGGSFIVEKYKEKFTEYIHEFSDGNSIDDYRILTKDDLCSYSPIWREPIHTNYKNSSIYMSPPPSQVCK